MPFFIAAAENYDYEYYNDYAEASASTSASGKKTRITEYAARCRAGRWAAAVSAAWIEIAAPVIKMSMAHKYPSLLTLVLVSI